LHHEPAERIARHEVAMKGISQEFGLVGAELVGPSLRLGRLVVVDTKAQHRHMFMPDV